MNVHIFNDKFIKNYYFFTSLEEFLSDSRRMNYFGSKYAKGGSYQFKSLLSHMNKLEVDLSRLIGSKTSFTILDAGLKFSYLFFIHQPFIFNEL